MEVGEEGRIYTCRYTVTTRTVTTRMTFALRWAAMRAILMFHNCEGQTESQNQCPPQTIRTVRADGPSPGRPPRLSHSS